MRRLFIYLFVAMLVIGALRAIRSRPARFAPPPPPSWHNPPRPHEDAARRHRELTAEARRNAQQALAEAHRAMEDAGREVRQAYHEARDEVNRTYREARDEIRQAYREVVADGDDRRPPLPPPPAPRVLPALEEADGLPVPIVPGTRVTEAEARPPVPARPPAQARLASRTSQPKPHAKKGSKSNAPAAPAAPAAFAARTVSGDICATEDRARADARKVLQAEVAKWLEPDVPASWTPPAGLLQALVIETKIDPHAFDHGTVYKAEDYGALYRAKLTADFSPHRRAELVDVYNRELVQHRLVTLGGSLGFVLICLAAISGYIRADEATKGYYTNRLRLLAAAGVGAAGAIVYKMVA